MTKYLVIYLNSQIFYYQKFDIRTIFKLVLKLVHSDACNGERLHNFQIGIKTCLL